MSSFQQLVHELVSEETHWGSWCAKPQAYFRGEMCMPGAKYHVGFQVFTGDVDMEVPHFHHSAEEYLAFLGAGVPDIFDFDAEIEIKLGEDPDHMETMIINRPTMLRIPPNLWHCPIKFHISKPLLFQAAYLDGTWSKILRREISNGRYEYLYEGDNVRMCKLEPGKRCTLCGKCFVGVNEASEMGGRK